MSLKAQLILKEAKAAEAIRLHSQLSYDELSVKAASLKSEKDKLTDQVSMLETRCSRLHDQVSGYELFMEQYEAVQDEQVKILSNKSILLLWEERGHAIDKGIQDGLAVGIDHGKAGRGLVDTFAKANYVSTMNALRHAAKALEANQLQPSSEQLMLPIHRDAASCRLSLSDAMVPLIEPLSVKNLVGEASTSGVLAMATTTVLSTTFTQTISIPSISVVDYEVSGAKLPTKVPSPPNILFEKKELETTPERSTAN
nr:hypothetical protein [Tanacetum cinerariifolium]